MKIHSLALALLAAGCAQSAFSQIIDPDTAGGRTVLFDRDGVISLFSDIDDGYVQRTTNISFWGQNYTYLNLSSNGHINWDRTDGVLLTHAEQRETWRMYSPTHAGVVPRISFLGEDLNSADIAAGHNTVDIENDTADFYAVTFSNQHSYGDREVNPEQHSSQVVIFRNNKTVTNAFGSFNFLAGDIAMSYWSLNGQRKTASTSDPAPSFSFRRTTSGSGDGIDPERGQTLSIGLFKGDATLVDDPLFGTKTGVDFGTNVPIVTAPADGIDTDPVMSKDGWRRYKGQLIFGAKMLDNGTVLDAATDERSAVPGWNGPSNRFVLYRWDAANNTYVCTIEQFASASETLAPTSEQINLGSQNSGGNLASWAADDNNARTVCKFFVPNATSPIISVNLNYTTTKTSPTAVSFDVKVSTHTPGPQSITLNLQNKVTTAFVATSVNNAASINGTTYNGVPTGTLADYVGGGGAMTGQILIRQTGPSTALLPCSSFEFGQMKVTG